MTAAAARARAADPFAAPVAAILTVQQADGAIPWFDDGPWDAWNHGECVMALGIAGAHAAAVAGIDCLAARQGADGSWPGEYGNALPMAGHDRIARVAAPVVRDTNFTAYVATVVLHRYRLTGDAGEVRRRWPMVAAAIDHVVGCQHAQGDISWCAEAFGTGIDDALVAANASIYASIGHALDLAHVLGIAMPRWDAARERLGAALRTRRDRYDRRGTARGRFAMDWYYPVLAGVVDARAGRAALDRDGGRFVDEGFGCRCVEDEPWTTVAESCELAMAHARVGDRAAARRMLDWAGAHRDATGALWMGWQQVERIPWPAERPSWTQAAWCLAVDAVERLTPAHGVLIGA